MPHQVKSIATDKREDWYTSIMLKSIDTEHGEDLHSINMLYQVEIDRSRISPLTIVYITSHPFYP